MPPFRRWIRTLAGRAAHSPADAAEAADTRPDADARVILDSISDAFLAVGDDWRFTYVNGQAERVLGRTAGELLGQVLWDAYPGLAGSPFEVAYRQAVAERRVQSVTAFYPDHKRWYEARAFPAPRGLSIYFSDVSEQRRQQAEVERLAAESERQKQVYETALSNSPDFNYVFDLDGRFTYVNQALLGRWGRTLDDAVGRDFHDLGYPAELAARLQRQIREVIDTAQPVRDETPYAGASRARAYEYIFVPVTDAEGRVVAVTGSTRDITARKQIEHALRDNDRRKDEFLAVLAHELRNPLAPLGNGLEIIRRATDLPPAVTAARDMMGRQLAHLVRLVDDLMDASRISRGKVTLRRAPVRLDAVLRQAAEAVRPLAEARSLRFDVDLPPPDTVVDGDATRLAQVFGNLLHNAVKFSEPGGRVRLTVDVADDHVDLCVSDTGSGIAPEMLPRVFDMFSQADGTVERSHGGLGIGLSLVKALVALHGGLVEAESDGLGHGSRFTVRLRTSAFSPQAAPAPVAIEGGGGRVLVVDDNVDAAESMAELLQMLGATTEVCHDGLAALQRAPAFQPQVIFLDIGMPGLNGHDTARRIRASDWGRDVVLVALTGWGNAKERQQSQEAGFDHHLVKPSHLPDVQEILARATQPGALGD